MSSRANRSKTRGRNWLALDERFPDPANPDRVEIESPIPATEPRPARAPFPAHSPGREIPTGRPKSEERPALPAWPPVVREA